MKKISCILKNVIIIFFDSVLFILIILSASRIVEAQEIENVPETYGYYILKDGEWVEIPEVVTTRECPLKGDCSTWGILGIDSKPEIVIEKPRPIIFAYEQGGDITEFKLFRLWYFEKLRAVDFHGEPPAPGDFKELCGMERNSLQSFGKWTAVGTHSLKSWPSPKNPKMICIRPKEKLPSGVYAIYQGLKFSSSPTSSDLSIPLRVFEISGVENTLPELTPESNPRVTIIKSYISDKLAGIENLRSLQSSFLVSANRIVIYVELKAQRSGEIVEFILYRPDGTIQTRSRQVIALPEPGRIFHLYQEFTPSNLLMPGKWELTIEVYGILVKCIPFYVNVY